MDDSPRIDVYPVGLLSDLKRGRLRYGIKHYLWHQIKRQDWRAVRNYFNGYLAEHDGCHHNAGRGWTQHRAMGRASRICIAQP